MDNKDNTKDFLWIHEKKHMYDKDSTHEELFMHRYKNNTCTAKTPHVKSFLWIHSKKHVQQRQHT